MRILHVLHDLTVQYGGPSRAVRAISRTMAAQGHDVTIYTTNRDWDGNHLPSAPNAPHREDGYTVRCFAVPSLRWPVVTWPIKRYVFSWPLFRALRESIHSFDVVHVHSMFNFTTLVACTVARRAGVPYVVSPHGAFDPYLIRKKNRLLKRTYVTMIERRNLNAASALHFTTEEEAQLVQPMGLTAPPAIIALAVDGDTFTPASATAPEASWLHAHFPHLAARKAILFFGRLTPKKGLDLLIPAFAQVIAGGHDAHLFIVGPDSEGYSAHVRHWVTAHGLGERVTFVPFVDANEAPAVLRSADVFVLSSYTENFGLAVVEALATSTPVVISDRVNLHREVFDAGAGIVTSLDVGQIAKGLSDILANPERARAMGEQGRQLVEARYTWERVGTQLEHLYTTIQGRSKASMPPLAHLPVAATVPGAAPGPQAHAVSRGDPTRPEDRRR